MKGEGLGRGTSGGRVAERLLQQEPQTLGLRVKQPQTRQTRISGWVSSVIWSTRQMFSSGDVHGCLLEGVLHISWSALEEDGGRWGGTQDLVMDVTSQFLGRTGRCANHNHFLLLQKPPEAINLERSLLFHKPQVQCFQLGQPHCRWLCHRGHAVDGMWRAWQGNIALHHGQGRNRRRMPGAPQFPLRVSVRHLKIFHLSPTSQKVYHCQIIHLWRLTLLTHWSLGTFQMQTSREAMVGYRERLRVCYFLFQFA